MGTYLRLCQYPISTILSPLTLVSIDKFLPQIVIPTVFNRFQFSFSIISSTIINLNCHFSLIYLFIYIWIYVYTHICTFIMNSWIFLLCFIIHYYCHLFSCSNCIWARYLAIGACSNNLLGTSLLYSTIRSSYTIIYFSFPGICHFSWEFWFHWL